MQPGGALDGLHPFVVSILTRSSDRMQRDWEGGDAACSHVSILTRSSDRMQLDVSQDTGANQNKFQSSPGRLTGCNCQASGLAPTLRSGFNPHPVV